MARTTSISARLTDEQLDRLDELCARMNVSRAGWLSALVADALSQAAPARSGRHGRVPSDCPHPRARVIKGFCYACGRMVS